MTACSNRDVQRSSKPIVTHEISPANSPTNSDTGKELLASIPEKQVSLYGEANGVTLRVGEDSRAFDWLFATPAGDLPHLQVRDYDGDGRAELAVDLFIGSGTGISVQELHIIDIDPSDPEYFIDHAFKDYVAQIDEAVRFNTYMQDGDLFGQISIGSESYSVSLQDYQSPEFGKIGERLYFGNIVRFDEQDERLKAQFGAGMKVGSFPGPEYIGKLDADVSYKNGKFTLSHFIFEKNADAS